MKRTLCLIGIAAATSLFSCSKNAAETPAPKKPTLTLVTPSGGEVFRAGESITVTWKSSDLPEGSVIMAFIESASGGDYMRPENMTPIFTPEDGAVYPGTANDGIEVFRIHDQSYNTTLYNSGYGKNFLISVYVAYVQDGKWVILRDEKGRIKSQMKTALTVKPVLPAGCTSESGYSVTTGGPCSVPTH